MIHLVPLEYYYWRFHLFKISFLVLWTYQIFLIIFSCSGRPNCVNYYTSSVSSFGCFFTFLKLSSALCCSIQVKKTVSNSMQKPSMQFLKISYLWKEEKCLQAFVVAILIEEQCIRWSRSWANKNSILNFIFCPFKGMNWKLIPIG